MSEESASIVPAQTPQTPTGRSPTEPARVEPAGYTSTLKYRIGIWLFVLAVIGGLYVWRTSTRRVPTLLVTHDEADVPPRAQVIRLTDA